ncbi:hypothetical protein ANAPC5_01348 [Anaplasma phagocytophilum]|nr:hypothetical protein ANAPC5_01348 [Anaplasma phagocytophilum]
MRSGAGWRKWSANHITDIAYLSDIGGANGPQSARQSYIGADTEQRYVSTRLCNYNEDDGCSKWAPVPLPTKGRDTRRHSTRNNFYDSHLAIRSYVFREKKNVSVVTLFKRNVMPFWFM